MDTRTFIRGGSVAFAMTALLTAAPASAQLSATALDCRATIAKNMQKLVKTAHKVIGGCHKSRDKDPALAGMDCNDMDVADAAKLKFDGAATKAVDTITPVCSSSVNELTAAAGSLANPEKQWYVSCPVVPCDGVLDTKIDTIGELTSCLVCVAANSAEVTGEETMGLPTGLDSAEAKCHGSIAKGFSKYLNTAYKEETACQTAADDAGTIETDGCVNVNPKDKVSKALQKALDGIAKSCEGVSPADLDGCAVDTIPNLASCSSTSYQNAENDLFTTTYYMEAAMCPTAVRTTIRGGCSTTGTDPGGCSSGFETGTVLSVGWKGLAHGVDVTDNYTLAVDVTCTGSEKGSCGTCTSQGISYDNPQYQDFARCKDDPWTKCTNVFGNDPACNNGGGGECKYYLGPPLSVSAAGTPTCTLNIVNTDIVGGTGDPDAGTADFDVDLRAIVHLGIGQERPCPYCRNDPAPQDGNTSGGVCQGGMNDGNACASDDTCPMGDCVGNFGECFGGPRNGQPCDVQGFDLTFANRPASDSPSSGNSLDCPPTSGANISGSGLVINLPLTTGVTVKDAEDPCESPNETQDCFCGICSGATSVSCNNDQECADLGAGNCTAGGLAPGVTRLPNNCTDTICYPTSSDRGVCSSDIAGTPDIDNYCSGMVFANGKGLIACGTDADCESLEEGVDPEDPDTFVCPNNDCGTCTVSTFRSCFNDPITISGTPDPENPILAGAFCLPPSSNGSVNSATGSPGPGTVQTDTLVQLRY